MMGDVDAEYAEALGFGFDLIAKPLAKSVTCFARHTTFLYPTLLYRTPHLIKAATQTNISRYQLHQQYKWREVRTRNSRSQRFQNTECQMLQRHTVSRISEP